MKLRYKIGIGFLAVIALGMGALALTLSHNSECPPPDAAAQGVKTMKSIRYHCYGAPEVLKLENVARPVPGDHEILVRVEAASVNPLDWHYMRGEPYFMRLFSGIGAPTEPRLGVDFAGKVESVGAAVSKFRPGDEVFGGKTGAFSEYLTVNEDRGVALMPLNMSFEQAASVGVAGVTALQGLRDKGQLRAGQKVLINGASGGVGTFAVQIASAMGAEVTGVCSERNAEMVRSIGADYIIDYKKQDFTQLGGQYDLILDNVGNHSLSRLRSTLTPGGTLVMVGDSSNGKFIGPLLRPIRALLLKPFVSQHMEGLLAQFKQSDMITLAELMRSGELEPVVDRVFKLNEIREAIDYSETGRARAKIVIQVR